MSLKERLNVDQLKIHDHIINDFLKSTDKSITIGGYAGTGKTYLITAIGQTIRKQKPGFVISYCSFTGKAASVLQNYLSKENIDMVATTIHSLIYRPVLGIDSKTGKQVVKSWKKIEDIASDLIIVDEGSMVTSEIWKDLLSFKKKIIVIGDSFQLPPVGEDKFNLMNDCTFKLTEIHRQAETSAIISLSKFIRQHGYIPPNKQFSSSVFKTSWNNQKCKDFFKNINLASKDNIVLCGFNRTRNAINLDYRKKLNYREDLVYAGDKIICLKNNRNTGLKNGHQGIVMWVLPQSKHFYKGVIEICGEEGFYESVIYKHSFGKETYDDIYNDKNLSKKLGSCDVFDYSYAISVHKSQASEWDNVVLIEQRSKFWDDQYFARWIYTGVTRAKKSLFVISDCWEF